MSGGADGVRGGAAGSGEAPLSIVVVVSAYPPHHRGGYELRCRDVCRELARRGHKVTVLTSRTGARGTEDDGGVRVIRQLHAWPDGVNGRGALLSFILGTSSDCRRFRRAVKGADVVTYWHQSGLTSALLAMPRPAGCGVLCDVSSDWLLDAAGTGGNWFRVWEKRAGTAGKRFAKGLVRLFAGIFLRVPTSRPHFPPGRVYYTSPEMRARDLAAGLAVEGATLIQSGIELDRFPYREDRPDSPRFVLFLSRIKRWKGLHTAVLALSYMPEDVMLRVRGFVDDPEYLSEVGELARASGTLHRVQIAERVPHDEIATALHEGHAMIFGSEAPEPFSRLVLEAFACGTPVVGTTIGGTGAVLVEGVSGLTFAPGNARELGRQLTRVLEDRPLRAKLVANARRLVETKYSLGFTVDQIERLLRDASHRAKTEAEGDDAPPPAPPPRGAGSRA